MDQSLNIATSFYSAAHYGFKKIYDPAKHATLGKIGFYTATGLLDFYLGYLPGAQVWVHEEYHRSVMARRGVNSFNGVNRLPFGSDAVSVNKVKDDNLIRMKLQAPQDFIRMQVAGIEGEYMMVDKLQRNNFFYNQQLPNEPLYLLVTIGAFGYVRLSSDPETVDVDTDISNANEREIAKRDFTGFDFTGWVYDLFRPNEKYEERGIHPSGVGIDRYRKTSDLTIEELGYLKRQGNKQLLNLLSPMLFGFRSITIDKEMGIRGNVAVRNFLTSFGNDISLNVLGQYQKYNMSAAWHFYRNYSASFNALELELVDYPIQAKTNTLLLSPKIMAGSQPKNQTFKTESHAFFGFLGMKLSLGGKHKFRPFVDLYAKTDGWIAGNEFLNGTLGARFGLSFVAFK